jgi:predicted deacylase
MMATTETGGRQGPLTIGKLTAEPGTKVQGYLDVFGSELKMPVTLINGSKSGKTVVITGGTHGGEYPGVEASIRIAARLKSEDIAGRVVVVHPVNVRAFAAKMQYLGPDDGKNLNRVFPGKATGTVSERIAYTITTELFSQADFYMDLHGGDIHEALIPFVIYSVAGTSEVTKASEDAASMMGIKYIVGSVSPNGSFGSAALSGLPGFLAEIGQCGRWSEAEVQSYTKGVFNVLRHLGVLSGKSEDLGKVEKLERMIGTSAGQTGCWYASVKEGDRVVKGQKTGEIRDFFARTLGEYSASQDGLVLYVASSLAINEGDPIVTIA